MPYRPRDKKGNPLTYTPKMIYEPIKATWGNTDKIIELHKQGKDATQISTATGDRITFVKRVISRLGNTEIEPIKPIIKRKVGRPKVIEQVLPKVEPVKIEPVKVPEPIRLAGSLNICEICHKEFPGWKNGNKNKYCSRPCYGVFTRKRYEIKRTPEEMAKRQARDKEWMKKYHPKYYKLNKEKIKVYERNYRALHKKERKVYELAYFESHKAEILARQKAYRARKKVAINIKTHGGVA